MSPPKTFCPTGQSDPTGRSLARARSRGQSLRLATASVLALILVACASERTRPPRDRLAVGRIVLDGSIGEWPGDAAVVADGDYLYFRFSVEGSEIPPQSASQTLSLWLDLDASSATGQMRDRPPPARTMGVDLEIQFAPRGESGQVRPGTAVYAIGPRGERRAIGHAAVDLVVLPTHAASWYEGRITRYLGSEPGLPGTSMEGSGPIRGLFVVLDAEGPTDLWSDPFEAVLPPAGPGRPTADEPLPGRLPQTLRVVSYNVHDSGPSVSPAPFDRLFQALQPDVVLVQEWREDAATLAGWFTALVPTGSNWSAVADPDAGVGVISRYELVPLVGSAPRAEAGLVRTVAARVDTPDGPVLVASVHLKCCGSVGTAEDQRRLAEARTIRDTLHGAMAEFEPVGIVVGGDLNLVGALEPMRALATGLDLDSSDLAVAEPFVLGDWTQVTWSSPDSPFVPGRLDYVLFSESTMRVEQAFVVDTSRLSPALTGLDKADTSASDHLPVVVDFRLRD